ncbi:MAG: AN1-type zinc finger domain-containing protein [Candidatus Thorarchaeota archaeon]
MPTCSLCSKEDLSFTCMYCNGVFCSEHRLPESHGCPAMHRVKEDARRKVSDSVDPKDMNVTYSVNEPRKTKRRKQRRRRFSSREIRDLTIASILVILVGISIFGSPSGIILAIQRLGLYLSLGLWWLPVGMVAIFLVSFMAHELAHKFVAQNFGAWSEFRMIPTGYLLSAMAILFSVPIFGTGVVYSSGMSNKEQLGKTNLAGPLTNFVIAAVLMVTALTMTIFTPLGFSNLLFQFGIQLNAFLGLFNMIPLQPFDGGSVREWSNRVWISMVIGLAFMLVLGYVFPLLGF